MPDNPRYGQSHNETISERIAVGITEAVTAWRLSEAGLNREAEMALNRSRSSLKEAREAVTRGAR